MSVAPICFLQSGNFRLDTPLGGLDRLPEKLRQAAIDAPYSAATRVFDAALAERVDFLVLVGDLCNLHAPDPRAVSFLHEQFTRLTDCGIEVFIASGAATPPSHWPAALSLPDGVRWFSSEAVDTFPYRRSDELLAMLCGTSTAGPLTPAEFHRPAEAPLALALAPGEAKPNQLTTRKFEYWGLGGRALAGTLAQSPTAIHFAGAPQGLCPAESGHAGCTLVRLDGLGSPRLDRIETDAFRYQHESVALPVGSTRDDLEMLLFERLAERADATAGRHLLVTVHVAAEDQLAAELHTGGAIEQLLASLREEYGQRDSAVWPVDIIASAPETYPATWREEDSVLGEYLRTMQAWASDTDDAPHDLSALVPETADWAELKNLNLTQADLRREVLNQATALGAALLSGNNHEA